MTFESIPDSEMPKVLAAAGDGRCIVCYREFDGDGFYCPECDDEDDEEADHA
ncbi:hypothetical protein ACFRAQ_36050 [Nocardia sp. NPDC056611]|uniref:hypothetical protein n=1 Tax=Nocardia sp. NPDC056611 TaxID=3345877 RepID=UPI0036716065